MNIKGQNSETFKSDSHYSLIPQIFIENLLCAKHHARH